MDNRLQYNLNYTSFSFTVSYFEEIPKSGPPTFSGRLVRYVYKLTIGAQKPNCPAQIIRIPIRVITIPCM